MRFVLLMLAHVVALFAAPARAGAPPAPTDAVVGKPIAAIDIEAPKSEPTGPLTGLIDIAPGFLLNRRDVQRAIERLYALDKFAQIEARVSPLADAVVLTFIITPRLQLSTIKWVGVKHVNKHELTSALRLAPGDEVDESTPAALEERAKTFLARQGYPLARVEAQAARKPGSAEVAYTVRVQEGPANRITRFVWHTDHMAPQQVLRSAIRARVGSVVSEDLLNQDRARLLELLHEHGFLAAQVAAPAVKQLSAGAEITFHVRAQTRVPLRIVGNHVFDDRVIAKLWPAALGGGIQQGLVLFVQRLEAAYAKEGYANPKIQVRLHGRPRNGRARVDVHINEGPAFWIDHLKFEGAKALPRDLLGQQVRAVLLQDLSEANFFGPLTPGDWVVRGAPQTPRPRVPHRIPAENRWIFSLYNQAADDIAAAYRDLGFLDVVVAPPTAAPSAPKPPRAPAIKQSRSEPVTLWPDNVPLGAVPPGRMAPAPAQNVQPAVATFVVNEGQQRFIDAITFAGNINVDSPTLLATVQEARDGHHLVAPVVPGGPLSYAGIEDGRIAIVRKLRDQGFLYAQVFAHVPPPDANGFTEVQFKIEEGPAVHVQRLLVRGNHHTREGVIRSRITLKPGQLYKLGQAINDQRDIMALGVFNSARVRLVDEEHPSEGKDVVAEVDESPRQLIEVIPGLSTTQGMRLKASYSHLNVAGTAGMFIASAKVNRQLFFDLYGSYADKLKTRFNAYKGIQQLTRALEREVRVGLRSPPIKFLRGDPLLRLDVVDQRINAVRYGLNSTSAILGADLTVVKRVKMSVDLQAGITELECPLGNDCDQDLDVRRLRGGHPIQQGTLHTIKFGPTVHVEGRDDPISPSRGYYAFARVYQAFGAARGTGAKAPDVPFSFLKWEGIASTYLRALGQVLALSGRVGSMVMERSNVPVDERFFLGGRDTLRGFVETTLIPQDACVVQDTTAAAPAHCAETISANPPPPLSLGGNTYVLFKGELRMPLRDRFSLDVFADVGNLWVNLRRAQGFALRVGTGAGLRYATPVGALTVDVGINTSPRAVNREPGYQVHFSIGSF